MDGVDEDLCFYFNLVRKSLGSFSRSLSMLTQEPATLMRGIYINVEKRKIPWREDETVEIPGEDIVLMLSLCSVKILSISFNTVCSPGIIGMLVSALLKSSLHIVCSHNALRNSYIL
jgi:hypothetical protein